MPSICYRAAETRLIPSHRERQTDERHALQFTSQAVVPSGEKPDAQIDHRLFTANR